MKELSSQENSSLKKSSLSKDDNEMAENSKDKTNSNGEDMNQIGKAQTYYVEENEKFLNLLISNCEPILSEIVSKFTSFNQVNNIQKAFEQ